MRLRLHPCGEVVARQIRDGVRPLRVVGLQHAIRLGF
jgi:hypothetical protein